MFLRVLVRLRWGRPAKAVIIADLEVTTISNKYQDCMSTVEKDVDHRIIGAMCGNGQRVIRSYG